ncbi:MAG TPA: PepSY domain-containing protein [Gemmatimonadaceae bacterium]|nr:PepSY domain-containing protein [Gemmatimonadaceae bacterium]
MKKIALLATIATLAVGATASSAQAQAQSDRRIPISKDSPTVTTTSSGDVEYTGPLGYRLRPGGSPIYCAPNDAAEVARVEIKSDLYTSSMISPAQAKAIALCAVPGQLSSGEMQVNNGRTVYEIALLPTDKKTYSKVEIDAMTGEIINAKQFGGLRGLAGFLRESAERKNNKVP